MDMRVGTELQCNDDTNSANRTQCQYLTWLMHEVLASITLTISEENDNLWQYYTIPNTTVTHNTTITNTLGTYSRCGYSRRQRLQSAHQWQVLGGRLCCAPQRWGLAEGRVRIGKKVCCWWRRTFRRCCDPAGHTRAGRRSRGNPSCQWSCWTLPHKPPVNGEINLFGNLSYQWSCWTLPHKPPVNEEMHLLISVSFLYLFILKPVPCKSLRQVTTAEISTCSCHPCILQSSYSPIPTLTLTMSMSQLHPHSFYFLFKYPLQLPSILH